jgi:GT2 family glycosyltransferase
VSGAGRTAVTVVVPTCGDAVALERAIASILATGYEPLEVVVVENAPPAPSTRSVVARSFSGAPVHYLEEPRKGASRARNAGLALADGDVVAFTDDDVVVDPGWLRNAVTAFEHPDVACVTGRIQALALDTRSQLLFEQFAAFDKGPERRMWRLPESRAAEPLFPYIPGHVGSGANVFVRREVARRVGGFDIQLGPGTPTLGGEDLDLFVRLVQAGYAIVYDPSVLVHHDHPDSLDMRRQAYGYGVGLTAMLAKQLVHGPARRQLIRAIPGGIRYVLDPNSRKNAQKPSDFPRSLELLERVGMLLGPGAYLASLVLSAVRTR